ncbi:glycosyltransferase [Stutzerimonas balearica]|uniref:glycosyltransferase n=1 Tax=Stutzerimonas balearica TaxID=74829 RepID=UPI0022B00FEC|nr:glycosyltransferase [Stutzerimonas balearica]MCZ4128569.1 glycosyltransferase [Stutzerimonas balearica]
MRLLFDVTRLLESGLHTGIQRVVRCLLRAGQQAPKTLGAQVAPVRFDGDRWYLLPGVAPHPLEGGVTAPQSTGVEFMPGEGDHLLMFDASWYLEPWRAVDRALGQGAMVHAMVHDVLPVEQPGWFRPGLQKRFADHLEALLCRAGVIFVPTIHVQERLLSYAANTSRSVRLECLPHGGDFLSGDPLVSPRGLPEILQTTHEPVFLVTGTLEPRKQHGLILDAFDELWKHNHPARLLFVGRTGWKVDPLIERIANHPNLNDRLFHMQQVDDGTLDWLYRHVDGLIYLSRDEGFGLPVLEASMRGCPVIATDLPVLHEAGGRWPLFISPCKEALTQAVLNFGPHKPALAGRTWASTFARLVAILEDAHA